jgi:hypothetical protein
MGVCGWVGGMPPQELKSIKFFLSQQERKRRMACTRLVVPGKNPGGPTLFLTPIHIKTPPCDFTSSSPEDRPYPRDPSIPKVLSSRVPPTACYAWHSSVLHASEHVLQRASDCLSSTRKLLAGN